MLRTTALADLLLPLAVGFIQLFGTHFAARDQPERHAVDAFGFMLLAAGPLALVFRRQRPALVLWLVNGITLAYLVAGYPYGPVFLSMILAFYTAVTAGQRNAAWAAAAVLYVAHFGARYLFNIDTKPTVGELGFVAAWMLVILAGSEVARVRNESALEAEQMREQEARQRAGEERLQIARELHDVLAHNISLINVQSGVALHLMDRQPEQARSALTAIEAASRDALTELRSVLDILRQPDEGAPRAPSPDLSRLDALIAQAQAAGLQIETRVEGEQRPLPAPIEAAAFRIIQEALTNVIRHAGASKVTVDVAYRPHELDVAVEDNGRGPQTGQRKDGAGSGIEGMRERARALGGEFEAGPAAAGRGFRVTASLPLEGAR